LIYQRNGQHGDAIAQFRRVVDMKRNSALGYRHLALAYQEAEQPEKAMANFIKCLDYDRDDVKSRYSLATMYRQLGQVQDALEQYTKVIVLDRGLARSLPEYKDLESQSHREIALIYEGLERDGEALHHWGEHDRLVGGSAEAQQHRQALRSKIYK
jgi:tetratricopeptide (TPR) repeat protein